jgi:hypothetical protein
MLVEAVGLAETFISANLHGVITLIRFTLAVIAVRVSELTLKLLRTLFVAEFFVSSGRIGVRSPVEMSFSFSLKRPYRFCGAHRASC